jgi:hypothetical protein
MNLHCYNDRDNLLSQENFLLSVINLLTEDY